MSQSVQLKAPIPPELVEEFIKRLCYVSESLLSYSLDPQTRNVVAFDLKSGDAADSNTVANRIVEVADSLCKTHRAPKTKILVTRNQPELSFLSDPHLLLTEMDEWHKYGEGWAGFGPRMQELIDFFDCDLESMASRLPAVPFRFPSLIGADVLDRCRYLKSFPSTLTMVSHLRGDSAVINEFAKSANWNGTSLECNPESLSSIQCLLSPAVCFHYYAWLMNRSVEPTCITAKGKCFRYESKNMTGLERLWDFTMREIVFTGPGKAVLAQRQMMIDETVKLLDRWELSFEIRSATDPFFVEDYSSMAAFQLAFDLKFEILTPLPYKQKDLAVGSFNYHQDFFGRSFGISTKDGNPIHTGCVAFGLERVALAFLAQHGLDPKRWPPAVAKELRYW